MSEGQDVLAEEADVPEEALPLAVHDLIEPATKLANLRRHIKKLEEEDAQLTETVLALMERVPDLHGVRLKNGDAVRRAWSTSQSKIEPVRLREVLADAPEYIIETVDAPRLHKDYPSVWERLAKVKRRRTVQVRLA